MILPIIVTLLQVIGGVAGGSVQRQLQTPESTTPEKDRCVVAGRVVSMQTGEPLKKASLQLILQINGRRAANNGQSTGYSATSGPDGSFKFEAVEPGDYTLRGERTGYLSMSYGAKSMYSGGTTISLQPGQQLTDLKMQLIQQATISGRVLDEDGDPASGLQVQALGRIGTGSSKARYFPQGNATTDDTGAFRISNLRPGKYYVSAQNRRRNMMGMVEKPGTPGTPDVQQVRTFYPSSLDRAGASAIEVGAGQEMPGMEIRMRAVETFHVSGKLVGEIEQPQGQPSMIMLAPDGDDWVSTLEGMAMVGQDRAFYFSHVKPGSYTLTMPNLGGQQKQYARTKVEVGNADVSGIVLTVQPGLTIRGSIELQGIQAKDAQDKPAENISVFFSPDDTLMMSGAANAMTKADGTFTLEGVAPAKFKVQVSNEPDGAYIKSIRFGGQEVMGKTIDLTQGAGGDIRVVIRAGAPEVSGTVSVKTDNGVRPAISAHVMLIPDDYTQNGGNLHSSGTNQNGSFDEKGIAPGTYYVVALDSDEFQGFQNPAVLKQLAGKGTKVELKENDKQQMQLTLTAPEDVQAAIAAGGSDN